MLIGKPRNGILVRVQVVPQGIMVKSVNTIAPPKGKTEKFKGERLKIKG